MYAFLYNITNQQSKNKIFIDTTLPNIGDRWKEIYIPVYKDKDKMNEIKNKVEEVVESQWNSLKHIDEMKRKFDIYNT